LRSCFERIQAIRYGRPDDFDAQLLLAEVQEEVIARARSLGNDQAPFPADPRLAHIPSSPKAGAPPPEEAAEIPENVTRIEPKTLKWAIYLAVLFTGIVLAAFFYLIQTARRINMTPNETSTAQTATNPAQANSAQAAASALTSASTNPTLRLYTDLVPGTVAVDDNPPQDLKDGELILDNLQPGQHSIKVTGRSGNAAFSFEVSEKLAPRVIGLPVASNAMAVLVSQQDGQAGSSPMPITPLLSSTESRLAKSAPTDWN
jgi:hypothetical protein